MMRSSRPSAATAARKSHVPRAPCGHQFWCARGECEACDARAVAAANGRFDRIIVHGFGNRAQ
eukprot:10060879-Lingulodinium_polyedra.AAC.1